MSGGAVLADAAHAVGERVGQDGLVECFVREPVDLVDRCAVVAAVELAQELAAVAPLGGEQPGHAAREIDHAPGPFIARRSGEPDPQIRVDHVGAEHRALEIEHGEHLSCRPCLRPPSGATDASGDGRCRGGA